MTSNLTYSTIKSAISGDANAINAVVDFFQSYLTYLSYDTTFNSIDEDMKRELETHLISKILLFEIRE